jgi:hypothetical protein
MGMSEEAKGAHATLVKAYELVISMRVVVSGLSPDTAFAIGEAAGALSKARALLGRDIDQAAAVAAATPEPRRRVRRTLTKPQGDLIS